MHAENYLPISALQHLVFCERQCALIHVEGLWVDNRLTVEGSQLHQRVDEFGTETRRDVRTARGVRLVSDRLRLVGRADVVEFHKPTDSSGPSAATLAAHEGQWRVRPVEYKRGRPKSDRCDEAQLCAQALCLEEMLGVSVEHGSLYYGKRRQRTDVSLDAELRAFTENHIQRLHELVAGGETPRVPRQPKCGRCSMFEVCLPHATSPSRSAAQYLEAALRRSLEAGPPQER